MADEDLIRQVTDLIDIPERIPDLPPDEIEYARHGPWDTFHDREIGLRRIRAQKIINLVRASSAPEATGVQP